MADWPPSKGLVAVAVAVVGRVNFGRSQRQRAIRSGAAKRQYGMGDGSFGPGPTGGGRPALHCSVAEQRNKRKNRRLGLGLGPALQLQRVPVISFSSNLLLAEVD